jgi:hypothetical protein
MYTKYKMSYKSVQKLLNYPKCSKSFNDWLISNPKYLQKYCQMGSPKMFDVSLRDGLQGLSENISLSKKIDLYKSILKTHDPHNIELGSIVSKKVLPMFVDTIQLYNFCENYKNGDYIYNDTSYSILNKNTKQSTIFSNQIIKYVSSNNWILVPNEDQFDRIQNIRPLPNLSFITSASNAFQIKNTKMTINESINQILNILTRIDDLRDIDTFPKIKIYVSCITDCPVDKKFISYSKIMDTLVKVNKLKPDIICLSDTCGTLDPNSLKNIMKESIKRRIPLSRYGLHLHVNPEKELITEELIYCALDYGIQHFDLSILESGGCSVTIPSKNKMYSNLSYELYYKSLVNYILNSN